MAGRRVGGISFTLTRKVVSFDCWGMESLSAKIFSADFILIIGRML